MTTAERDAFLKNDEDIRFIKENRSADWEAICLLADDLRGSGEG
jgi:hypothetical protein